MTKEKLKRIVKRLPYILNMLRSGKSQTCVYISGEKELISIDEDVTATLQIMKEIIENEEIDWRKNIFTKISKGYSDASIMVNSPIGRTKYYDAKKGIHRQNLSMLYIQGIG